MKMEPKDYIVERIEGEYAILKNIEDGNVTCDEIIIGNNAYKIKEVSCLLCLTK